MVTELYQALRAAGVDDDLAKAAAESVLSKDRKEDLATKADLAELKSDLIKWNVGTLIAMTALFSTLITVLKLFA
jgi:hypothetical protein